METIKNLNPQIVWSIFDQILQVPRPSKKEEQIRKYLTELAGQHNLEYKIDSTGNVIIIRQASQGFESHNTLVLQSHMDMVCEKDSNLDHDFLKDPINAYIEDGWVKAKGTTLGADCGIGMAMSLAVLIDQTIECPKIEALFTYDEEQGLTGAMELDNNVLTGKYLINLDSEDEGEIFIGCAGGVDTLATFDISYQTAQKDCGYMISVGGLLGGHSGDDIEKGRACANKLLIRVLTAFDKIGYELVTIDGGNLRNAIAREAHALVRISKNDTQNATQIFKKVFESIKSEYANTDPDVNMTFTEVALKETIVMSDTDRQRLVWALQSVAHGVIAMSHTMPGLVETSTNLASVKMDQNRIIVTTSQRSSVESAKFDIANTVEATFKLAKATVTHTDGYPGWTPNPNSFLVKMAEKRYLEIFSKHPKVKAIHAGLECGLILEKYPKMEAISIGPTLRGVHSPSEKIEIQTVAIFWQYLVDLIKNLD